MSTYNHTSGNWMYNVYSYYTNSTTFNNFTEKKSITMIVTILIFREEIILFIS